MSYLIDCVLPEFSAAHRLINGYQGKCNHLHGHNYLISVAIKSKFLNNIGFVADFSAIKKNLGDWVLKNWDHVTLLVDNDLKLLDFLKKENMRYYVLLDYCNTTAEVLAEYLFKQFVKLVKEVSSDIELYQVTVAENERSSATYRL